MFTPTHRAEGKLLNRRRQMDEELGTYSAAGRFRSRNPKLYHWPTTPQLVEWAAGATAGNRPGAFSRDRLSRAGRSGLDLGAGMRVRALSNESSNSAGSDASNGTRLSRGALSHRAARGLRATLWPQVENEIRWLQRQFENDLRVTRMEFADHYEKMENGLMNVSDKVTGLHQAVQEFTVRVGGDAPGNFPVKFPDPVPNIFDSPPRRPSSGRSGSSEGDTLSVTGQSVRTASPQIPGRYPRSVSNSSGSPENSRVRRVRFTTSASAPESRTQRQDTRPANPRRATVEDEEEADAAGTSNGTKRGRRPSDYVTADEEWEERRTAISNAKQRNPFCDPNQPPRPPAPRPRDAVYPDIPEISVQPPSPQDGEDDVMSGAQISTDLEIRVPARKEDNECWRYWPQEARPPKAPLSRSGQSRPQHLPLTLEDSDSNTPTDNRTPEERVIAYYTHLRNLVCIFCQNTRLVNLGPCKRGVTQDTLGARQFPFATSFPDSAAPGAMRHAFFPLPAVDPLRWNDYSKDQRWWIIVSGIMEILWDKILSERGMREIIYRWRNKWGEFSNHVVDSIYYSLKPVWNQWVLDDENEVYHIKSEIRNIVKAAHCLKWLTRNLDQDTQLTTATERFILFVPQPHLVESLLARDEWGLLFQRRGELDDMQDAMGENTRALRGQIQTSEELNLITGNPLYMFAFPALLRGMANQETGQWSGKRLLLRGWVIGITATRTGSASPPAKAVPPVSAAAPAAAATPGVAPKTGLAAAVASTLAAATASASTGASASSAANNRAVDKWDDGEGNVGEYSSWEQLEDDDLEWNEEQERADDEQQQDEDEEEEGEIDIYCEIDIYFEGVARGMEAMETTDTVLSPSLTRAGTEYTGGEPMVKQPESAVQEPQSTATQATVEPKDQAKRAHRRKSSFDWAEDAQQAADEAEAKERELAQQKEMEKQHVVETQRKKNAKKEEDRRKREQKEEERKEREEALAKRQREEKAAEVKRQFRKEKKKKNKGQKTVAQMAAENAARLGRNSS